MKKMITMFFLILFTLVCKAPENRVLYIEVPARIQPYQRLIDAVTMVESNNGIYIWNPVEEAVGWFQIRPVRLQDYNRQTGKHYTMKDLYDYNISKEIFLFYCHPYGNNYELIAKKWNGSGPKTIKYWNNVKKYL